MRIYAYSAEITHIFYPKCVPFTHSYNPRKHGKITLKITLKNTPNRQILTPRISILSTGRSEYPQVFLAAPLFLTSVPLFSKRVGYCTPTFKMLSGPLYNNWTYVYWLQFADLSVGREEFTFDISPDNITAIRVAFGQQLLNSWHQGMLYVAF